MLGMDLSSANLVCDPALLVVTFDDNLSCKLGSGCVRADIVHELELILLFLFMHHSSTIW